MLAKFEMSMVGELTYFLGFQMKQMKYGIFISQSKYAKNIVKKFGLENSRQESAVAHTHVNLSKDEHLVSVYQIIYISMIGSLLHITSSQPDITFLYRGLCLLSSQP